MLRLWVVLPPLLSSAGAVSGVQDGGEFSSVINFVIVLFLFVCSFIATAVALLVGAYLYRISQDTRTVSSPREMKGKTVIVTGANSGELPFMYPPTSTSLVFYIYIAIQIHPPRPVGLHAHRCRLIRMFKYVSLNR